MSKTLETKKKILDLLKDREMTVTELSQILGLSGPTVAQHISELQDMGAIEKIDSEHFKKLKFYKIKDNPVFSTSTLSKLLLGILVVAIIGAVLYLYTVHGSSNQKSTSILYVGNSITVGNLTVHLDSIIPYNGVSVATFSIGKHGIPVNKTASLVAGGKETLNLNGTQITISVSEVHNNSIKGWAAVAINTTVVTTVTTTVVSTVVTSPPTTPMLNSTTTLYPPAPPSLSSN